VDLSRRPDPRNISAESLSRIATYCAALAGGNGDDADSGWWWYTAVSLDQKQAQRLLPELQKAGLLRKLPAPRSRTSREPLADGKFRRPTGQIVEGTPPRVLDKPKAPAFMFPSIRGVASATVEVELVASRTGRVPAAAAPQGEGAAGACVQRLPLPQYLAFRAGQG